MSARPTLIAIVTAVLVATAGCSGFSADFAGSAGEENADTTTPTGAGGPGHTPTPTATPAPANLDRSLVSEHLHALRDAGSFRAETTVTIETNDSSSFLKEVSLTTEYAVDYEHTRAIQRSSFVGSTVTYSDGETVYQQTKLSEETTDENATYRVANVSDHGTGVLSLEPVNRTEAAGASVILVGNVTYRRMGTETFHGVEVTRYEANGTGAITGYSDDLLGGTHTDPNASTGVAASNTTIESFSATLLVDAHGVVRLAEWSITVVDTRKDVAYSFGARHVVTGVGETTIEEPDWLEHARNSSGGSLLGGNCTSPAAEGEVSQSPAGDGTYNVTFAVTSLGDDTVVTLDHAGAEHDTLIDRSAYFEGDTATATGLEPGDTITVVARNTCGDTKTIREYTVEG